MSTRDKKRKAVFQEKVVEKWKSRGIFPPPSELDGAAVDQNADSTNKRSESDEKSAGTSTEVGERAKTRVKIYTVASKPSADSDGDVIRTSELNECDVNLTKKKPQTAKNRKRKLKKKRRKAELREESVSISFTYNPTTNT